jgi:hypothetical protein
LRVRNRSCLKGYCPCEEMKMALCRPELTWRRVDSGFYHLAVGHEASVSVKEGIDYLLHLQIFGPEE